MGKTYEEIKTGANTFASATIILETVGQAGLQQASNDVGLKLLAQTMIPAITLKAFTCELALKAMVAKNELTYGSIHELDQLYEKISEDDKKKVSDFVVFEMKKKDASYGQSDFEKDLKEHAKLFVDWRYFFEKNVKADLSFVTALFNAVREVM